MAEEDEEEVPAQALAQAGACSQIRLTGKPHMLRATGQWSSGGTYPSFLAAQFPCLDKVAFAG